MILLDPDLESDSAPVSASAKRAAAPASPSGSRLPSARTLARFLTLAQAAVRLKGQVSVLLTTDPAIRRLNRQFRGKNKATDVLSFPADGVGAEEMAGDLAISVPTARRQAAGQGHPLATEIKILMLHGLLHLAGYDHEADEGQMARRERLLRGRLGLPQGLIERVEANSGKPPAQTQKLRAPSLAQAKGGTARPPGAPSLRHIPAARVGKHDPHPAKTKSSTTRRSASAGAPSLRRLPAARVGKHDPHPAKAKSSSTRTPGAPSLRHLSAARVGKHDPHPAKTKSSTTRRSASA